MISVIVPVYNTDKYLKKCLSSIELQTYQNFECLIVNDGSTDTSQEIASSFSLKDKRFKILNKTNGGLASARNFGMKFASGAYLAFIDADDYWIETKLETQVKLLFNNQWGNEVVLFGQCLVETEDGKRYLYLGKPYRNHPAELLASNSVSGSGSGVLMPRSALTKVGLFEETLRSFEDLEYWFRLAISGYPFVYNDLPEIVILKRNTSLSADKRNMMKANIKTLRLQLNYLKFYETEPGPVILNLYKRVRLSIRLFTPGKYLFNFISFIQLAFISIQFIVMFLFSYNKKQLKKKPLFK